MPGWSRYQEEYLKGGEQKVIGSHTKTVSSIQSNGREKAGSFQELAKKRAVHEEM